MIHPLTSLVAFLSFAVLVAGLLSIDVGLSAGYENVQELLGHLGGDEEDDDDEEEEEEGEDEESSAGVVSVGSIDDDDDDSVDGARKQQGDKSRGQVGRTSKSTPYQHTISLS